MFNSKFNAKITCWKLYSNMYFILIPALSPITQSFYNTNQLSDISALIKIANWHACQHVLCVCICRVKLSLFSYHVSLSKLFLKTISSLDLNFKRFFHFQKVLINTLYISKTVKLKCMQKCLVTYFIESTTFIITQGLYFYILNLTQYIKYFLKCRSYLNCFLISTTIYYITTHTHQADNLFLNPVT